MEVLIFRQNHNDRHIIYEYNEYTRELRVSGDTVDEWTGKTYRHITRDLLLDYERCL